MWQLAIAAASAAYQKYSSDKAGDETEDGTNASASAYYESAVEELRRLKSAQALNLDTMFAASGASGVMSSTTQPYRSGIAFQQDVEADWEEEAIERNANAIRKGGSLQGNAIKRAGRANAVATGLAGIASYMNTQ